MKIDEDMSLLSHDELLILSKYDFRDPNDIPHPPYNIPELIFLYLMI